MPSPRSRPADTSDTGQHTLLPSQGPMQFEHLSGSVGGAMKVDRMVLRTTVTGNFATTSVSEDEGYLSRLSMLQKFSTRKSETRGRLGDVPGHVLCLARGPLYRPAHAAETVLKPKSRPQSPIAQHRAAAWSDRSVKSGRLNAR